MSHCQARTKARKNDAGNHCGRMLTLERLESRCCMDASSHVVLRDAAESISDEVVSRPQDTDSPKIVEFHMQLRDLQRNNVESVHVGDQMYLQVYVRDLRESIESNFRFFSVYTKVSLEENQFQVLSPGEVGRDFWEDLNQLEREVGGLVVSPYPNGEGHLVFEVPILAIAEGEATIQTEPLQGQSAKLNSITLFGVDHPLDTRQVGYQSLPVTVLPKLSAAASETNQPHSPVIAPSQTAVVIPPTIDNSSSAHQPPFVQPTMADDPTGSPASLQSPTAATDIQKSSELYTANASNFPSTAMENLHVADREFGTALNSQETENLVDHVYRDTIGFDQTDYSAEGVPLQELARAHLSPEIGDACSTTSLTIASSLNIVLMTNSRVISNQRLTALTSSRMSSQKIIHRMLQRLGAYSVDENADFQWDLSYMRIPVLQLKLQSDYVRNHQSTSGSRFEEFVIPRVIVIESMSDKSNHAIPLTTEFQSSRANDAWSAYERVSMKHMSLSQEARGNSLFEDNPLEASSDITEGYSEKENALNQHEQSMMQWWIAGVLSLVASGAWFRDRGCMLRLLGSLSRKRLTSFSKGSGETED